ncbi:hypothetical protein CFR78_11455 [Komagataeibacter rhaeticus]|nr:RidA family protein [Komagataeibacter rhaeticus]PYD53065.1 hypothetical protein CFR78_11455 [Komagataeibacter rhaeticus]GBQ09307.1 endoribonuclease L-PSP [Komagataeibacter rhaeticus DSM 16663]
MTMTEIIKLKSGSLYEDRNSYSRIFMIGDQIFVSNTAGIDYTTREISPDVAQQARKALQNINGALQAVGSSLADTVRIITHVPTSTDMPAVAAVLGETFRNIDPAGTMVCTPLARRELKVEFEVTAIRGASSLPAKYIRASV